MNTLKSHTITKNDKREHYSHYLLVCIAAHLNLRNAAYDHAVFFIVHFHHYRKKHLIFRLKPISLLVASYIMLTGYKNETI